MTSEEILANEFDLIRRDLIAKYDELGLRASGAFERELFTEQRGLSVALFGAHYTEQLVNGREPGAFPPVANIEQWIIDKGISYSDISLSSLAFLIARKIANEGTNIFQQGGTDLIDSVITPERIQGIINKVSVFQVSEFVLNITNELKKIAA